MKHLWLLGAVALSACEAPSDERKAEAPVAINESLQAPASKPAGVVPKPAEAAQLDRMILAGYTPHADHLHPPGVNECPLSQGADVVM